MSRSLTALSLEARAERLYARLRGLRWFDGHIRLTALVFPNLMSPQVKKTRHCVSLWLRVKSCLGGPQLRICDQTRLDRLLETLGQANCQTFQLLVISMWRVARRTGLT